MQKLTKEQAIVISGYTMSLCCKFADLHEDIEKRLGRPVWTHELACESVVEEVKEAYKEDFLSMLTYE